MEPIHYIAAGNFVVAVIAVIVALSNRRDSTSHAQMALIIAPVLKDVEVTKIAAAQAQAQAATLSQRLYELEIKTLDRLKAYPTIDHFDATIERALAPILEHVVKTETFMQEVLRSGVLRHNNGNHRG